MMGYYGACMIGYTSMSHFWVTIENYDVSTELIIIFIIELGIWVILACPNFIRVRDVF